MMTAIMSLDMRCLNSFIGTVMQIEKALINDCLRVLNVS